MMDKVRVIRSLRWGRHGYANLRHARMLCPEVWDCHHLGLDWRWSGNLLHPTDWSNDTLLAVRTPLCGSGGACCIWLCLLQPCFLMASSCCPCCL